MTALSSSPNGARPHAGEQWQGSLPELLELLGTGFLGDYCEAPDEFGGGLLLECPVSPGDGHFVHAVERRADHVEFECAGGCDECLIRVRLLYAHTLAACEATDEGTFLDKLRRLDVARMVQEEPQPPPWVVEGLVVRGMLTVLHGREGLGKSLLALALAAGVATGQDEAGLVCRKGRVVIVDAENGEYEIHRRVHALGLPSNGVDVFEVPSGFDLRSDLDELEQLLAAQRPHLLVLDSFRSLWGGKENDSGEVAAALDPLRNLIRRFQAGTLLLHHSGRGSGEYRGSSAIGASCELGFGLHRSDDEEDRSRRYLETWKCRPGPEPPRRWVRLSVEDGQVFIDSAEPAEREEEAMAGAPIREELTPKVLDALSPHEPRTRADIARAVGREPKDRSVGRVLDGLAKSGRAQRDDDGWRRVAGSSGSIGSCHPATLPPSAAPTPTDAEPGCAEHVQGFRRRD